MRKVGWHWKQWAEGSPRAHQLTFLRHSFCLVLVFQAVAQPFQTLVQTLTRGGAGGLDEPWTLSDGVQTQFFGDLSCRHGLRQILLVGENQKGSISDLIFVQHSL